MHLKTSAFWFRKLQTVMFSILIENMNDVDIYFRGDSKVNLFWMMFISRPSIDIYFKILKNQGLQNWINIGGIVFWL